MLQILEFLMRLLVILVIFNLEDGRLDLKRVFAIILIQLLVEQFDALVVHEQVFTSATLIEIVIVLIIFFRVVSIWVLQLCQGVNLLFFFVLLFD